jgi:hypothetical protein
MRFFLVFSLCCLHSLSFCQWSAVHQFDISAYNDIELQQLTFADEQHGGIIGKYINNDTLNYVFFKTSDGGAHWNPIYNTDFQVTSYRWLTPLKAVALGRKLLVEGALSVSSFNDSILNCFFKTTDGGLTWQQDTIGTQLYYNWLWSAPVHMAITSDGYALAVNGNSMFYSQNDGQDWSLFPIVEQSYIPFVLGNSFASLTTQNLTLIEPATLLSNTVPFICECDGQSIYFNTFDNNCLRIVNNFTGNLFGYSTPYFSTVTVGKSPFDQVISMQFPDKTFTQGICTNNDIYLIQGPSFFRSLDNGATFFQQFCTEPEAISLSYKQLLFVNDSVGYALAYHPFLNYYKLVKTTNSGGITSSYNLVSNLVTGFSDTINESGILIHLNDEMQILEINSEKPIKDVQIKDLSGKIVYQSSSSDNKLSVDISGLTSAVYVVIVITNNAHYQKKIFKY